MSKWLREGATEQDDHAVRQEQLAVAEAVWDFCATGYGPGGAKLIDDGEPAWEPSPAAALRHVPAGTLARPYLALADSVHALTGDGGTTALMLASGIVKRALQGDLPAATMQDGIRLARRQGTAWLDSVAAPATHAQAIDAMAPGWGSIVDGLEHVAIGGAFRLDQIDVQQDDVPGPTWAKGIVLDAGPPRRGATTIHLCTAGPRQAKLTMRLRHATQASQAEQARIEQDARRLAGAGIVACATGLGELGDRLRSRGITVAENVPLPTLRRLERLSGASIRPSPDGQDLGDVVATPRPARRGGIALTGAGPSATLLVPRGMQGQADEDLAERVLRMLGATWDAPRLLDGGGRWHDGLASNLRQAASHAPGKTPLALELIAAVLDDCRRAIVRNAGKDPLSVRSLEGNDVAGCIAAAWKAGLDTAEVILRLDGRYAKRPSQPADLRGGLGPSGSPKGMPGDIPPLM